MSCDSMAGFFFVKLPSEDHDPPAGGE
jgi:hypothetical protein